MIRRRSRIEEEGGWGAVYCSSSVYKSAKKTNKKIQVIKNISQNKLKKVNNVGGTGSALPGTTETRWAARPSFFFFSFPLSYKRKSLAKGNRQTRFTSPLSSRQHKQVHQ